MRMANTHLPSKSAVALHYIRLSEQQYRAASRAGRGGGTHHHTLALQEEKGKGQQAVDNCALLEYIGYRSYNCVFSWGS